MNGSAVRLGIDPAHVFAGIVITGIKAGERQ